MPFIHVDKTEAVHSSVWELFSSGWVPLLIPSNRLFAFVDYFLEAPPLRETIVFLVLGDPIPVVSAAAIVLQRHLGRIEAEFGGYPVKHNLMGDAC